MKIENFKEILTQADKKLKELASVKNEDLQVQLSNLKSEIESFNVGGQSLLETNNILQIGVVGHMNVGKSSFLNSIFFEGESVLPNAATTMTAGLSFLEYGDENTLEIEFYSEEEWNQFITKSKQYEEILREYMQHDPSTTKDFAIRTIEKDMSNEIISAHQMVKACTPDAQKKVRKKNDIIKFSDKSELKDILNNYVGINGEFTQVVKCTTIKINDDRLKGIRIVDTPGTSDPVVSREMRTQNALNTCHGVFLLSYAGQFFSSDDQAFLRKMYRNKGIARIVILASKYDAALEQIGFGRKGLDLGEVSEKVMSDFRKRVSDTLSGDNIDIDNIKIDFTSNITHLIGFIFEMNENERKKLLDKKDEELNLEEQNKKSILNTIYNLREIYPDRFDNDEEIRESCDDISNFDEIQKSYIEEVFKANKEIIIGDKIQKYFKGQQTSILKNINDIYDYFKKYRSDLEGADIEKLRLARTDGITMFNRLNDRFLNSIGEYMNLLKTDIAAMLATTKFQEIRKIPFEYRYAPVRCKGMIFGHNRPSISFKHVDIHVFKGQCKQSIDNYANKIIENWESFFDSRKDELNKKLIDYIFDYNTEIQSDSFDLDRYAYIVSNTTSKLGPISILDLTDIVSTYVKLTDEEAYKNFHVLDSQTEDFKKSEIDHIINSLFDDFEAMKLKNIQLINEGFRDDIRNKTNDKMNEVEREIDEMKENFLFSLQQSLNNYTSKLENDISQKVTVLKNLDNILNDLKELESIFK